tara:strand:- start:2795 stop:3187 length:393 start_codon:yes stop_codon:yes gene_type:complete
MNIDIWTLILLHTKLDNSYFLISKMIYHAFQNAVKIKINNAKPIEIYVLKNKKIMIFLEYRYINGWGLNIRTKKRNRFFTKKNVQNNNLWVESPLIISVNPSFFSVQYFVDDIIHYYNIKLSHEFTYLLF